MNTKCSRYCGGRIIGKLQRGEGRQATCGTDLSDVHTFDGRQLAGLGVTTLPGPGMQVNVSRHGARQGTAK